jgi:hypothetical protein
MHRRGYDDLDEYRIKKYGPDHLGREIVMQ